jgi:uncharacterized protein (TIRG00374 family)
MKYLKILLIVVIIAVLLFFFLENVNFGKVVKIISSVDLIYPLIFFVGLYLQFFIRGYRWGLLLKPHKKKIPLMTLYSYTVIGFLLNLIPGKVGEPARGILLANEIKIPRSYGLASVVLERLIDMLVVLLIFILYLFFTPASDSQLLISLKRTSYFVFPLLLLFFLLFYFLNTDRMFGYVERLIRFLAKLAPSRIRERLVNFGINFVRGLRLNLSFGNYIKLIAASIIVWLFLIPFYWILMRGFEFGGRIGMLETIPYFSILVASASIPTPGMAGSFDAASRLSLEQLYAVNTDPAAAYTILAHFLILAVMVIPGLAAFWSKGLHLKTIKKLQKETENAQGSQEQDEDGEIK